MKEDKKTPYTELLPDSTSVANNGRLQVDPDFDSDRVYFPRSTKFRDGSVLSKHANALLFME